MAGLPRAAGHDCAHVYELGLGGQPDEQIMAPADRENRILISADTDFGELLANAPVLAPGVILLRRAGEGMREAFGGHAATGRAARDATWDRRREWTGPVFLRGRHSARAGGRVPQHQGPRGVSGAFVDISRARNSPRHSSSYRLTTLIVKIKHMRTRRCPWEGHRVPDWCRLSLDTRVSEIADTPSRRSS